MVSACASNINIFFVWVQRTIGDLFRSSSCDETDVTFGPPSTSRGERRPQGAKFSSMDNDSMQPSASLLTMAPIGTLTTASVIVQNSAPLITNGLSELIPGKRIYGRLHFFSWPSFWSGDMQFVKNITYFKEVVHFSSQQIESSCSSTMWKQMTLRMQCDTWMPAFPLVPQHWTL